MATTGRRKLLTAAVGVATVSYVMACGGGVGGGGGETSGNLVATPGIDEFVETGGAGNFYGSGGASAGLGGAATSGNLVAAPGCCPPFEPPRPEVDAGIQDAAVPPGSESDAAPAAEDAAVDSGP